MYFVMLCDQRDKPVPMVNDKGEVALYDFMADANDAADNNPLGKAYGYQVFEWCF